MLGLALFVAFKPRPACTKFTPSVIGQKEFSAPPCMFIDTRETIYLAYLRTSLGPIRLLLDPILAPADVNNFVFLAKAGVYDNIPFSRVESTSEYAYVQTGDPTGTGRGNAGYTYRGTEPSPIVRYQRRDVVMAHQGSIDTNGSQFFIVVRDFKNGLKPGPGGLANYSFLGVVVDEESFITLDAIVALPLRGVRPVQDVIVHSVMVSTVPRDPKTQGPPDVLPSPS